MIASVKGTRDLLPPETRVWNRVEAAAREVFALYGFDEIRTPVLESTELFVRSVGESTDIVHKEMYTFTDRGGRSVTLRPENTAGVARAYVEHALAQAGRPWKLYYIGPQFRYERPQKGRYREFRQIGAEVLGPADAATDAELLVMLFDFLGRLGFTGLSVSLNSVGTEASATGVRRGAARRFFLRTRRPLGEDDRRRLAENPLRVLDSKDPAVAELVLAEPRSRGWSISCRRSTRPRSAPPRAPRRFSTRPRIPYRDRSSPGPRPRLLHAHGLRGDGAAASERRTRSSAAGATTGSSPTSGARGRRESASPSARTDWSTFFRRRSARRRSTGRGASP